jgi:hypothetical protein
MLAAISGSNEDGYSCLKAEIFYSPGNFFEGIGESLMSSSPFLPLSFSPSFSFSLSLFLSLSLSLFLSLSLNGVVPHSI